MLPRAVAEGQMKRQGAVANKDAENEQLRTEFDELRAGLKKQALTTGHAHMREL